MRKEFIKNRKGQKFVVIVEEASENRGLCFVMHGLGGWKEEPHIETFAKSFIDNDITAVRFDAANTFGESEGNYEDATTTKYMEDLEDVIAWASNQSWYSEPFFLAGHSLGGFATSLYAEDHPEKVKGLAPVSSVVSGQLSAQTPYYTPEILKQWKETGWKETESSTTPGRIKRIKWAEMEDRLKKDLLPKANKLTMPVLLIVGSEDTHTPPEHQKILYAALPGKKEMHIIEGAPHTFKDQKHLEEIKNIFDKWIKTSLNT